MTTPFPVHEHTEEYFENTVYFQLITLADSIFAWVGTAPSTDNPRLAGRLDSLAVAMPTKYDTVAPGTSLLGGGADDFSERLAKRLATKLKRQIFVSLNLTKDNDELVAFAEKRLAQLVREIAATGQ
ncbi:proteasome (prosome, macropain) assembly chaperone 4 [Rhizophlyctis rosea]|nr:proteasome (prosome, macropain) assembly chaperone 4 [Rhizophlyctis rosea]